MEQWKKLSGKVTDKSDKLNMLLGVVLIAALIFVYRNPYNKVAILAGCIAGGLMNILSGIKTMKNPKRKTTGMSYIMMGIILILLGCLITRYFM